MLTLEETGWSLKVFKAWSILNILPIGVDVKSGKIEKQSNRVKVFLWKILFGVGVSHWFYMFGRLVQSTVIDPQKYFRWDHFVLHFAYTFVAAVFYFNGFCVFMKSSEETVMIFNRMFSEREDPVQKIIQDLQTQKKGGFGFGNGNGNQGNKARAKSATQLASSSARQQPEEIQTEVIENQIESTAEVRPLLTWPPQYSLDELVAKLYPLVMSSSGVFAILIFAVDPSRPQLLYSVLPPEYRNSWTFSILLAVEALFLGIVICTGCFSAVTQLLFFGKCRLEFQRMSLQLRNLQDKFQNRSHEIGGREIEKEIWILGQILEEMRELVLFIELFNRCFPFCIFALKIFSLSVCMLCYFFCIRHFEDFPVLASFMGYIAIVITLVYTIMYEHAFSIPGKMDELKKEFLLTAQKTTSNSNGNKNTVLGAEMKREIKRIHGFGIKVGNFNKMERESTPRFVDFVVNQVVSLLVAFPR